MMIMRLFVGPASGWNITISQAGQGVTHGQSFTQVRSDTLRERNGPVWVISNQHR